MPQLNVKIRSIKHVTHNVLKIVTDKPYNFNFDPGQATEISINEKNRENECRPFTFTCLPSDNFLEFTIKTYPERKGVTSHLLSLNPDDELILHDVFGAIAYKGEGIFIAGGAGVTPFIAIFKYLNSKKQIGNNKLIFSNKTVGDIILKEEFENLLGDNFINILSEEKAIGYPYGHITKDFLKSNIENFKQNFYICGPSPMMEAVIAELKSLGVPENLITTEEF